MVLVVCCAVFVCVRVCVCVCVCVCVSSSLHSFHGDTAFFPSQDETDFSFKLKLRKRKKKNTSSLNPYSSSLTPSSSPNQPRPSLTPSPRQSPKISHTNHSSSLPNMLGQPLSSVREEASLFTVGGKEEEEEEEHSSSSTSISVELGEDPLTQAGEGVGGGSVREMVGQYMSLQDQQNIRSLVKEFVSRLLPYLEAVLRKKNESVSFSFLLIFLLLLFLLLLLLLLLILLLSSCFFFC